MSLDYNNFKITKSSHSMVIPTQFACGMFLVSLLWRMQLDDIILKRFQRSRDWETRGGRTRPEGGHARSPLLTWNGIRVGLRAARKAKGAGGTPLNNPLIDFCALLSKSKLHF